MNDRSMVRRPSNGRSQGVESVYLLEENSIVFRLFNKIPNGDGN